MPTCQSLGGTCLSTTPLSACPDGSVVAAQTTTCSSICCLPRAGDACAPYVEDCGNQGGDCACPGGNDPQKTQCVVSPATGRGVCDYPAGPTCGDLGGTCKTINENCDAGSNPMFVAGCADQCCVPSGGGCTSNTQCPNGEVCNGQGACVAYVVGDGVCTPNVESCGNSTTGDCPCPGGTHCSPSPYPGICVECTTNAHCAAGNVCDNNSCISAPPACGDGTCNSNEDINSCEADCKGDGVCAPYVESCGNSSQDCPCPGDKVCSSDPWPGVCVDPPPSGPVCDNGQCEAGENCNSCSLDCGECPPDPGPSCGGAGGDYCSQTGSCPEGATNLGDTYDCSPCCLVGELAAQSNTADCGVTMSCVGGSANESRADPPALEAPAEADDEGSLSSAARSGQGRGSSELPQANSPQQPPDSPPGPAAPRPLAALPRRSFVLEFEQVAA